MTEFREPQRKCISWYMRSGSAEKRHLQTKRRKISVEPSGNTPAHSPRHTHGV